jgi:hypothetical protein
VVDTLPALANVVAVAVGGSRAMGRELPDGDWDLGIYYRGTFDADGARTRPRRDGGRSRAMGRLVNEGAWLSLGGERVDLLYRDLDVVSHWMREAEVGRFEVERVAGYVAGMPTYVLAAEVAVCKILHGDLPPAGLPERAAAIRAARAALGARSLAAGGRESDGGRGSHDVLSAVLDCGDRRFVGRARLR